MLPHLQKINCSICDDISLQKRVSLCIKCYKVTSTVLLQSKRSKSHSKKYIFPSLLRRAHVCFVRLAWRAPVVSAPVTSSSARWLSGRVATLGSLIYRWPFWEVVPKVANIWVRIFGYQIQRLQEIRRTLNVLQNVCKIWKFVSLLYSSDVL